MISFHPATVSLAGGEVSLRTFARSDTEKYQLAARSISNFLCRPEGPVVRRPGTQWLCSTTNSTVLRRFFSRGVLAHSLALSSGHIRVVSLSSTE